MAQDKNTIKRENYVRLHCHIHRAQKASLEEMAQESGQTVVALVREALAMYIGSYYLRKQNRG